MMRIALVTVLVAALVATTTNASMAAPLLLHYDSFLESKAIGTPISTAVPIRMDGQLPDSTTSSIQNSLEFIAGSTSISMSAAWLTAPPELRMVGVNVDVIDLFNNTVVGTDTFLGVSNGIAASQFSISGLTAGAGYRLLISGTAAQAGRYVIDLANGPIAPAVPPVSVLTPAHDRILFDTHEGSKRTGGRLDAGDKIQIDGVLAPDAIDSVDNKFTFVVTGGIVSAGIAWIVGMPGDPQRTVGVNVDLVDFNGNVVKTDSFFGVTDGQAYSNFVATGLTDGTYTLEFSGTAPGASRYRIDLATDLMAPAFRPIVDIPPTEPPFAVPEPDSLAVLSFGLAAVVAARRRHVSRIQHG
jgi:hypothetical protein